MRLRIAALWGGITLLGLGVAGTTTLTAQETENPYTSRIDVRMGQRQFRAQCAGCHGLNATGGEEAGGPDLTTGQFRRASGDPGLFRVIRDGVQGTSMIGVGSDATDQSIWQLVTYLRSLDPSVAAVDLAGSAATGARLFAGKGNCETCHMVNGQGRRLGPDLSDVGRQRGPLELQADLANPDAEIDPRWWTMRVTGPDDEVVEGLRMSEDTFTFRIMDGDENLRAFPKYGDWSYERIQSSTMPSYTESLTTEERDHLVAYLSSLRREQ